jgi:hypothetical protein
MGTTASGLRYPEPTDPVAQGAQAIHNLADDVTAGALGKAALSLAMQPAGAAAGSLPVRYAAGQATLSLTNGTVAWAIPNGGKPWTQIFCLVVRAAGAGTGPVRNDTYATSASGTTGTFYVSGYNNGVLLGTGAVNVHFFAVGQ